MAISEMHFKKSYTVEELAPLIRSAWIKAHFVAPWIAVRTSSQPNAPHNSYMFMYKRSSGPEKTEAWAGETIVWRKETKTLNEWEVEMKDRHWKPCAGQFGLEMRLAKWPMGSGQGWFLISWSSPRTGSHWTSDGRDLFPVAERMFRILHDKMDGMDTTPCASLRWREEVNCPTTTRTIPIPNARCRDAQDSLSLVPETKSSDLLYKRYYISMTSAINSIRTVTVNIADMRTSISPFSAKRLGDCGTGGLVNIGFPTKHDTDFIRQCLYIGNDRNVHKSLSPSSFWEDVATDTQAALKEGYLSTVEQMALKIDGFVMSAPGIMSSSLGDVEKLRWFTKYRPLYADKYPDKFEIRNAYSQFCCESRIEVVGDSTSQELWNMFLELVREGFQDIVMFKSAL
ncbi:hypothetical protein D9758_000009 [Tetrapyrgos nigripes]|uniref:Uncharacterized protein n=1 Tax=Tetrapyrgos nigripes TaxID=182062 RepID=A0A8H5LZK9_9AGAR|nr:hypothetical protein D9758_000009 [Tetrapyrgos nigripes]